LLDAIDIEQIQRLLTEALDIAQNGKPQEWRWNRYKKDLAELRQAEKERTIYESLKALMELEDKFARMSAEEQPTILPHPRICKYLIDRASK
jgi:acid stress-induced BolA-like protein IbaG/YrbA